MLQVTGVTPRGADRLLAKLSQGESVAAACRAQRISRQTYYRWREEDPEFAAAADDAIEAGTDVLEDIALKRAKAQSDTLIIFLLKGRRREKWGDKSLHEVSGPNGAPLTITLAERPDGPA
jgi:hypothetical protein